MVTYRLGRQANDPSKPRLKLSRFLATLTAPPAAVNWDLKVSNWPMYGNDQYGDCVWAMIGHAIQAWTANVGVEVDVPIEALLKGYSDVTGFDPADPNTDQGTVIQDALNYWRKTGIPDSYGNSHKILAFAEVDHTNEAEMQLAAALFGVVLLGINFPASAMSQFDQGKPWDALRNDGGIEGGHAILGARYDQAAKQWYWITWGKEQPVTYAFITKYLEEAWVAATPEWVASNGVSASGLNVAALNAAFTEMTGEPGPFPTGPVNPPKPPTPPGPPSFPDLEPAARALAGDPVVVEWLSGRHGGKAKHVAAAVQKVVDALGVS